MIEAADAAYRRALHRDVIVALAVFIAFAVVFAPDAEIGRAHV